MELKDKFFSLFSRLAYLFILTGLAIFLIYVAVIVWKTPLLQYRDFFITIIFFSLGFVAFAYIWKVVLQPIFGSLNKGFKPIVQKPLVQESSLQPLVNSREQLKKWSQELEKRVENRTSELKKVNRELLATEFELMERDKLSSMGEISAKLAHEIRNPLAIINNAVFFLKNAFKKPGSEVSEQIGILFQETDRINKLVTDLLQFSRISVSKDKDVEMIDVNEVLDDAIMSFESVGADLKPALEKKYAIRLPRIRANPGQLKQVFLNIIANAYQSMGDSGRLTIYTDVDAEASRIEIVFNDTGCGIAPENLKEIFTPFFSTKEPGKGTGLGLYICNSLIKSLNGDISVQSEVGKGTSFTISLPVRKTAHTWREKALNSKHKARNNIK
ncbi:MAG: ATP-binding protein [bacterium]|nr:ATP-binding protein [bacterium]